MSSKRIFILLYVCVHMSVYVSGFSRLKFLSYEFNSIYTFGYIWMCRILLAFIPFFLGKIEGYLLRFAVGQKKVRNALSLWIFTQNALWNRLLITLYSVRAFKLIVMIWSASTLTVTCRFEYESLFLERVSLFVPVLLFFFFFLQYMVNILFLSISSIKDSMFNPKSSGEAVAFDPLQFTNFSKVFSIFLNLDSDILKMINYNELFDVDIGGLFGYFPTPNSQATKCSQILAEVFLLTCIFGHHV